MSPERLRLLMADDEPLARDLVRRYAGAVAGARARVRVRVDRTKSRRAWRAARPDVALLDIRMPGRGRLRRPDPARAAPAPLPSVIFATAYDGYAVRAFEMNAIDYLMKPYSEERFVEAIRRVRGRQDRAKGWRARSATSARVPTVCSCRTAGGWCPIQIADIEWIKAEGDYVRVFAGGRGYLVGRTLKELEARLDPEQFVRVHRSALVQTSHIREVRGEGSSRYKVLLSTARRSSCPARGRRNSRNG